MERPAIHRLPRAWYSATFTDFADQTAAEIIGCLTSNSAFNVDPSQRDAWLSTIQLLQESLRGRTGQLLLEFNIPRMGLRADAVLLFAGYVLILEFKVGESSATLGARNQAWEYALDTKNFHEPSHDLPVVPVVVPTDFHSESLPTLEFAADDVCHPLVVSPLLFPALLDDFAANQRDPLDVSAWIEGSYRPTPTIIEAARHLYANHSVIDIVRTEADEHSLSDTARRVEALIERARRGGEKTVIFVTGVPGAGKTLVGLNIATLHRGEDDTHAVFLSGNGPLVTVLREALTRDDVQRRQRSGEAITKKEVERPIKAFIQNVHHFRDEGLKDRVKAPVDRIVIFDEAQRAWNREKAERWMRMRKGVKDFFYSEPEFLIECMNRHEGWAAIVCLVGGGQEIGSGEAGIGSWIDACTDRFKDWSMCLSDRLGESEYGAGGPISRAASRPRTQFYDDLHLNVSMRSFRAETVSAFVKALLDCDEELAKHHFSSFRDRFPIRITRDLDAAKQWVKCHARAEQRFGLLASSKAMRLRPHAIDIRVEADPTHYFLGGQDDVRSSYYLEDCATEFQVQGLELDWTLVTWDADMRKSPNDWSCHDFRGNKWVNINSPENRRNLKNAYRVLLTRARQGMVIFVPPGAASDPTRPPSFYDDTFAYFRRLGIAEV